MSQQNLIQVLRFVGSGHAGDSPLLAAATTEHGGAIKPPLKKDSDHYQLLAAWAEHMAHPSAAAGIEPLVSPLFPPAQQPAADQPPVDAQPLNAQSPSAPIPASRTVAQQPVSSELPEIPSLETAPVPFLPSDPFDPGIFNRRMHSRSAASGQPSGALPPPNLLQPKIPETP